ncbi:MAG: SLC13 family permease [Gemmatimonadales bacterium]
MTGDGWVTLAVLVVVVVILARDVVAPSVAVVGAVVALLVSGVVNAQQAFVGFSNPAPLTVAALYVLARAIEKTGALQPVVSGTLGEGKGRSTTLVRLLVPTAAASAFLNNTPIVAMLVPQVRNWADRYGHSVSRFLMPLSFAAILGGMVTLIGTSTNLVISGMLQATGYEPLGMFELTRVALPVALVGIVAIVMLVPRLLPERRAARREIEQEFREFVVGMRVERGGPIDGKSVESAKLRNLQGVFLVEIERDGELISPVGPGTKLHGGDRLTFVGRVGQIVDLQGMRGLASTEREHLAEFDSARHTFLEAVIGPASPLVGRTLKAVGFRSTYQAAVVAIHRAGQRVDAKLGSVRLKVGDTLLLLADEGFQWRWRDRNVFLLVSRLGGAPPGVTRKAWVAGLVGLGIVLAAGLGVMPILNAALLGAFALVVFGVLTPGEARTAVDLDVVLTIAGAFGLASALQVSGLASAAASVLVDVFGGLGPRGGLLAIVLATVGLVCVITNNAAAVLMFPIAMSTATELGLAERPFAIALALAASASFLTPVSYQTNLMVYGPGGYRFSDYPRLGLPLVVLVVVAAVLVVPVFWGL